MDRIVRIILIVLVTAFAASTVVHAAVSADMAVKIASSDMTDCEMCAGEDDASMSCGVACTTSSCGPVPFVDLTDSGLIPDTANGLFSSIVVGNEPPDPLPPRIAS